jgi:LysM repeat protein
MYSLARANGLTVSQLARANNISAPYTLAVGQRLSVPGAAQPVSPQPTVQRAAAPVPSGPNIASQQSSGSHVVKPGETLYSLGRAYNMHPHDIARANGLSNSTQLSSVSASRYRGRLVFADCQFCALAPAAAEPGRSAPARCQPAGTAAAASRSSGTAAGAEHAAVCTD